MSSPEKLIDRRRRSTRSCSPSPTCRGRLSRQAASPPSSSATTSPPHGAEALQLPARGRRREQHRRRLRDLVGGRPGYGDMVLSPDLDSLRLIPWLPRQRARRWPTSREPTALGVDVLAAPDPQAADRSASPSAGWSPFVGTELEFIVFDDSFRAGVGRGLPRPRPGHPIYNIDYAAARLDPHVEPLLRRHPRPGWRAPACMRGRPRASATSASRRSPSATPRRSRRADNHAIYKNGAKRRSPPSTASPLTFMAKFNEREGNSCRIHTLGARHDGQAVMADPRRDQERCRGSPSTGPAGLLAAMPSPRSSPAQRQLLQALRVEGSFAPTAIA